MNKSFYYLLIGYAITMTGSKIGALAQMFKSFEISQAVYGISILLLLRMLASIVMNPITFNILNKYPAKKIIIYSEILNGFVTFAIFLFAENFICLVILATLSAFLNCIFRPAFFSIIPIVVAKNDLNKANSFLSSVDTAVTFLGYSLSGILIFYLGGRITFLLDAFSYFISVPIYFLLAIPGSIPKNSIEEKEDYFAFFRKNATLLKFINMNFAVWIVCGFFSALEIPYLKSIVLFNDKMIGSIFSISAIGNIVGIFISNKYLTQIKNLKRIYLFSALFIIVQPIFYVLLSTKISFFIYSFIGGCLIVILKNSVNMFIFSQENTLQGKYFNHLFLINHVGMGTGLILATIIGDSFHYSTSIVAISLVSLLLFFLFVSPLSRHIREEK